jgi:hypothetical protein
MPPTLHGLKNIGPIRFALSAIIAVSFIELSHFSASTATPPSFKNISDRQISVPDVNLFLAHRLIVKDQKNRTVQLTQMGQQASTAAYFTTPRRMMVLGPGEEVTNELKISDFFNMKAKGVYTIVVERRVPTTDDKRVQTIRSNVIRVRVEASSTTRHG